MFVTVNSDNQGNPFEIFATIGKSGGIFAANSEAICRLISIALRSGISVEVIIEQLKGIRGPMPVWHNGSRIHSIPDAIAHVLIKHTNKHQKQLRLDLQKNGFKACSVLESGVDSDYKEDGDYKDQEKVNVKDKVNTDDVNKDFENKKFKIDHISKITVSNMRNNKNNSTEIKQSIADLGYAPECPECGGIIEFAEGCMLCRSCGYSKCG
jgi:ribonucleoside-diphosphate reductase alpha chain